MSYVLTEWKLKRATEPIQCQASEMMWNFLKHKREYQASIEEVCIMIKCVNSTIEVGWEYLCYIFVDENGEGYDFNCRTDVNKVMIKKELYPPYIHRAIEDYKNNYKK